MKIIVCLVFYLSQLISENNCSLQKGHYARDTKNEIINFILLYHGQIISEIESGESETIHSLQYYLNIDSISLKKYLNQSKTSYDFAIAVTKEFN